jgi:hypothetical protein
VLVVVHLYKVFGSPDPDDASAAVRQRRELLLE